MEELVSPGEDKNTPPNEPDVTMNVVDVQTLVTQLSQVKEKVVEPSRPNNIRNVRVEMDVEGLVDT